MQIGYMTGDRFRRQKNGCENFFSAKSEYFFKFCTSVFFLYDLINDKARTLKVAESNLMMKIIPGSLSVSAGVSFLLFLVHFLSLTHRLSLSLFFFP